MPHLEVAFQDLRIYVIRKHVFNESTKIVNMETTSAEKKFASAALAVFARYGVRKATMEEIAAEAGVSKPTLYATFKNKDATLGGAIRHAKTAALQDVRSQWASLETLPEKLDTFLNRLVLAGFDMLHNAPDAAAFDTAVGDASQEAIKDTRAAEIEALRALFARSNHLDRHGLDPQQFAHFFVDSAMNAKRLAETRDQLEQHLETLKATTLALFETQ